VWVTAVALQNLAIVIHGDLFLSKLLLADELESVIA